MWIQRMHDVKRSKRNWLWEMRPMRLSGLKDAQSECKQVLLVCLKKKKKKTTPQGTFNFLAISILSAAAKPHLSRNAFCHWCFSFKRISIHVCLKDIWAQECSSRVSIRKIRSCTAPSPPLPLCITRPKVSVIPMIEMNLRPV